MMTLIKTRILNYKDVMGEESGGRMKEGGSQVFKQIATL